MDADEDADADDDDDDDGDIDDGEEEEEEEDKADVDDEEGAIVSSAEVAAPIAAIPSPASPVSATAAPSASAAASPGDDVQVVIAESARSPGSEEAAMAHEESLEMLRKEQEKFGSFNLRVIFQKNRTGFEESKDFPIEINDVVAGRFSSPFFFPSSFLLLSYLS